MVHLKLHSAIAFVYQSACALYMAQTCSYLNGFNMPKKRNTKIRMYLGWKNFDYNVWYMHIFRDGIYVACYFRLSGNYYALKLYMKIYFKRLWC